MQRIKLASSAPIVKRTYYKIVIPTYMKPIRGIPVCGGYIPLWTHWMERSLICTNTKDCLNCQRKVARRWKGFMGMVDLTRKVLFIAEITPPIGRRIDALIESQVHLHTLQIKLGRARDVKNAPQTIEVEELSGSQLKLPLPKPFNPLPTILSTLGLGDEEFEIID